MRVLRTLFVAGMCTLQVSEASFKLFDGLDITGKPADDLFAGLSTFGQSAPKPRPVQRATSASRSRGAQANAFKRAPTTRSLGHHRVQSKPAEDPFKGLAFGRSSAVAWGRPQQYKGPSANGGANVLGGSTLSLQQKQALVSKLRPHSYVLYKKDATCKFFETYQVGRSGVSNGTVRLYKGNNMSGSPLSVKISDVRPGQLNTQSDLMQLYPSNTLKFKHGTNFRHEPIEWTVKGVVVFKNKLSGNAELRLKLQNGAQTCTINSETAHNRNYQIPMGSNQMVAKWLTKKF